MYLMLVYNILEVKEAGGAYSKAIVVGVFKRQSKFYTEIMQPVLPQNKAANRYHYSCDSPVP